MTPGNAVLEARLLNDFQRDLPLVGAPFAAIAARLDVSEDWVLKTLARALADGRVSRVGAVFRPGAIGVSTLAAMAVPEHDLGRVAAIVSAHPEVNHNYEREHRLNLWFVAAAANRAALDGALASIAAATGYRPLALPLVNDYGIDLGFDHGASMARFQTRSPASTVAIDDGARPLALSAADRRIVAALEAGLPIVAAPFAEIAHTADVATADVLARLSTWLSCGAIKRFGVVVRHRPLGFTANAMCVWDVPDAETDVVGAALAREPGVTLCYRRRRAAGWRYNLFCMLHGRDRGTVDRRLAALCATHGLERFASAVLFSRRAFKQCGARYLSAPRATPAQIAA